MPQQKLKGAGRRSLRKEDTWADIFFFHN